MITTMRQEFDFSPPDFFQYYNLPTPPEDLIVTPPDLYWQIALAFSSTHPIHQRTTFIPKTTPFFYGSEGESDRRRIEVALPTGEVGARLDIICNILSALRTREKGLPTLNVNEAYRSFQVIAANWISTHGCLGVDGHGRATVQLFPITMAAAGYPQEFRQQQFVDPNTGEFNMLMAHFALGSLNLHFADGIRLFAACQEMARLGIVSECLRNPAIIRDARKRQMANSHALNIVAFPA